MAYISIRNWEKYQHYKDRNPPWIKCYTHLLDDDDFLDLSMSERALWIMLLLRASRNGNATRSDFKGLVSDFRTETSMNPEEIREAIEKFKKMGWIKETQTPRRASKHASKRASNPLANLIALEEKKELKNLEGLELPIETQARTEPANGRYLTPAERKRLPGHCPECGVAMLAGRTVAQHLYAVHDIRVEETA